MRNTKWGGYVDKVLPCINGMLEDKDDGVIEIKISEVRSRVDNDYVNNLGLSSFAQTFRSNMLYRGYSVALRNDVLVIKRPRIRENLVQQEYDKGSTASTTGKMTKKSIRRSRLCALKKKNKVSFDYFVERTLSLVPITKSDLSKKLGIDSAQCSKYIIIMEQKGLIVREMQIGKNSYIIKERCCINYMVDLLDFVRQTFIDKDICSFSLSKEEIERDTTLIVDKKLLKTLNSALGDQISAKIEILDNNSYITFDHVDIKREQMIIIKRRRKKLKEKVGI